MEFYRCCLFVTFVVLTVDQFVGRDDGPVDKTKLLCFFKLPISICFDWLLVGT